MARELEPSVLLFHVALIGESSRRLISDTPTLDDLDRVFLLHLLCFHGLLPSSPITPRLLSTPLLLAPTGWSAASPLQKTHYTSHIYLLYSICVWELKGKQFLATVHNLG